MAVLQLSTTSSAPLPLLRLDDGTAAASNLGGDGGVDHLRRGERSTPSKAKRLSEVLLTSRQCIRSIHFASLTAPAGACEEMSCGLGSMVAGHSPCRKLCGGEREHKRGTQVRRGGKVGMDAHVCLCRASCRVDAAAVCPNIPVSPVCLITYSRFLFEVLEL